MDALMEKQRRQQLASLPFSEKIKVLEKLRRVSESAGERGFVNHQVLAGSAAF